MLSSGETVRAPVGFLIYNTSPRIIVLSGVMLKVWLSTITMDVFFGGVGV
jgi:hypothetical protein